MIKRIFDILASTILLLLFCPIMLLVAVIVSISMGLPVIYRQIRPGLDGRLFTMYKFRTMTEARGPDGNLLDASDRFTRAGNILRNTSLDELPELFNVLKGDMSIVGPRPLLPDYMDYYTTEQARRHEAKPGITGLAQISGRRNLPFSNRFELDVHYVDNWSLLLDLKILLLTVPRVLGARGVVDESIDDVDDLGLADWSTSGKMRRAQEATANNLHIEEEH